MHTINATTTSLQSTMIVSTEKKRTGLAVLLMLSNSCIAILAGKQSLVPACFGVGRRAAIRKAAAGISFFGTVAPAFASEDTLFLTEDETEDILWRAEDPSLANESPTVTTLSTDTEIESSKDPDPPIEEGSARENPMIVSVKGNEEKQGEAEVETREVQSTIEKTETTKESTPVIQETIESKNLLENENHKIEILSKDVPVEVKEVTLTTDTKTDEGGVTEETTTSITIADSSSKPTTDTAKSPSRRKTIEYICIERTIE